MKRNFWIKKLPVAVLASALVITVAAWQKQPGKTTHTTNDTIPDRNKKIRDIDDAIEQVEKSQQEVEHSLKDRDWNKDIQKAMNELQNNSAKMQAELDQAMKNFDAQKMQLEMQKAMKEVDLQKVKSELQANLEKVDMQQVKEEIAKAMKQIDAEKLQADLNASISKIDMEKMKAEMEKVKDVNFKQVEENLKNIQPQIEKSMQSAKESIEKAKKDLQAYKGFIDDLDKDGLINKKDQYKIQYKNDELIINGKTQPAETTKKYENFLKGHKDFTIKKEADGFNIYNGNEMHLD